MFVKMYCISNKMSIEDNVHFGNWTTSQVWDFVKKNFIYLFYMIIRVPKKNFSPGRGT